MYETELYHHGIKGQKWGIRRYQNPDGTLTEEGKERLRQYKHKEVMRLSSWMLNLEQTGRSIDNTITDEHKK